MVSAFLITAIVLWSVGILCSPYQTEDPGTLIAGFLIGGMMIVWASLILAGVFQ